MIEDATPYYGATEAGVITIWPHETDEKRVVLSAKCPICGKTHTETATADELDLAATKIENGFRTRDAFPGWPMHKREFIESGICPMCFEMANKKRQQSDAMLRQSILLAAFLLTKPSDV